MKIILRFFLGGAMLFPLLLYGQNSARDERAGGRNSAEIQREIFQVQREGFDLGVALGTAHALTDIGGTGMRSRGLFLDAQPRATGIQLGSYLRYHLSDMVALNLALNYARVGAADSLSNPNSGRFTRGYHFRNSLFEISLQAEVYLPEELLNIRPDIYAFAGFLVLFHEPQLMDAEGRMQPSKLESPQPVIPLGMGIHYTTLQNLRFGFQAGVRITFFDYLDGISPVKGPRNDIYFFNTFTFGYLIKPGRRF